MKNSADLGGCYPPGPLAFVGNTLLDLENFPYPIQPLSIIVKYYNAFAEIHVCRNYPRYITSYVIKYSDKELTMRLFS